MTIARGSSIAALRKRLEAAASGVKQALPPGSVLRLNQASLDGPQIVQKLASFRPLFAAVDEARANYLKAVAARRIADRDARAFLNLLRFALIAFYGDAAPHELEKYGLPHKRRAKANSQQKLLAAAKATLTRQARGTLGKRQKAKLKALGNPGVLVSANGVAVVPHPADGGQPPHPPRAKKK